MNTTERYSEKIINLNSSLNDSQRELVKIFVEMAYKEGVTDGHLRGVNSVLGTVDLKLDKRNRDYEQSK